MVVVEQFFHLTEQNHALISNIWRILPMIFSLVGSVCGILYAVVFGKFKTRFNNRCIFFSLLYNDATDKSIPILKKFINEKASNNSNSNNVTIDSSKGSIMNDIQWSAEYQCDFLQFTPIVCSVFGIAILALFVMYGKGGNSTQNGLKSPWRIVFPSLLASIIFSILSVSTLRFFNKGIYTFCADFVANSKYMSCGEVLNFVSHAIQNESEKIYQRMLVQHRGSITASKFNKNNTWGIIPLETNKLAYTSELFLGIAMAAWILCALFLVIRIVTVVDFQLVRITVRTVENEQEEQKSIILRPDRDEETETELATYKTDITDISPDISRITLASPEPSSEDTTTVELVQIQSEDMKKPKTKVQRISFECDSL